MDLTEAFAPGGGGGRSGSDDLVKTDFFDFVVSPPPHCVSADGISDEESFLQRDTCRSIGFLHDPRGHDEHERRDHPHGSSFIKETNNNTLTALPPVSTITGSLSSHHARNSHCGNVQGTEHIGMDQSDCDYWSTEDSKEQACSILLEDLNKYCWSAQANAQCHEGDSGASLSRASDERLIGSDRQNTDGAIYTLTVLNNEANSMDALDCCKSPTAQSADSWTLRPSLDIDAILSMDTSEHERAPPDNMSPSAEAFRAMPISTARFAAEEVAFVENKDATRSIGDNNNDWKLSDRNRLQEASAVGDSAESLLRSALQGKLYSGPTQVVSSSSSSSASSTASSSSSVSTTNAATLPVNSIAGPTTLQIIAEQRPQQQPEEHMQQQGCTEEELLLSQLDASAYRPGDYEKLKCIANEVVESYCNLEPVCNVSAAATTVMYTLDPASGSLGTITLAADLAQVGTVTVVTAAQQQQETALQQQQQHSPDVTEQRQPASSGSNRMQQMTTSTRQTKPAKKYCRRGNKNTAAGNVTGSGACTNNVTAGTVVQQQPAGSPSAGSGAASSGGSAAPRKERSLHYCSICSKGFKDKYSVNVHIRTHTGEKPFACSLCGKSFRQKAHLAKHYQTHVAQKPSVANSSAGNNSASPTTAEAAPQSRPQQTQQIVQATVPNDPNVCNPSS